MKNKVLASIIIIGIIFLGYFVKIIFFKTNTSYVVYMEELSRSAKWFQEKEIELVLSNVQILTPKRIHIFDEKDITLTNYTNLIKSNFENISPKEKIEAYYKALVKSNIKGLYIDDEIDLVIHRKHLIQYLENGGSILIRSYYSLQNINQNNSQFIFKYVKKGDLSFLDEEAGYYNEDNLVSLKEKITESAELNSF